MEIQTSTVKRLKDNKLMKSLIFLFFLWFFNAGAETITLIDGSVIDGALIQVENENLRFSIKDGTLLIPKKQVESIIINKLLPDKLFSTPERVFYQWVKAARMGDVDAMSKCYVSYSQEAKRKEMASFSSKELEKMIKVATQTTFSVSSPLIIEDKATMKIERFFEGKNTTEFIEFQIEKSEWKILP